MDTNFTPLAGPYTTGLSVKSPVMRRVYRLICSLVLRTLKEIK